MVKVRKKLFVAIIISMAIMSGCGAKDAPVPEVPTESPISEVPEATSEETAAIGNPWVDCNEEAILEKLDFYMCAPYDAIDVKCQMNESDNMAQMTFNYGEPELEYTYRVKKAQEFEDISGLYYDWTVIEKQQIAWYDGECKRFVGDNETVDVCQWYDSDLGLMYSLSTSAPDLDGYDITAYVYQFLIPADESDRFMPSNFLEAELQRDTFESFDEIISLLDKGNGYAIVKVNGLDDEVLMITEGVYDNLDGNMAAIDTSIYRNDNGTVICIGNVFSSGTAYPISLDAEGRIYSGGHHEVDINVIADETKGIMTLVYAHESFDENQNATYSGFIRENNTLSEGGVDIAEDDPSVLEQLFKDYFESTTPINFTVVE